MKKLYLILISLFLINCQKIKNDSKQFFNFDEIDYYKVDITLKEWLNIASKRNNMSKEERDFLEILNNDYPKNINDKNFIINLKKWYPKMVKIDSLKFKSIRNIYSEKTHPNPVFAGCEPYYRDILIFKKNQKIIGISKLCFECGIQSTIGSKRNTENLGQSGDIWKLKNILK